MPDGTPYAGREGRARIETGRFTFRAVPGDISHFNAIAAGASVGPHDGPYDITALSVRAWAGVADRYVLTAVGGSFGEGYGPKLVCRTGGAEDTMTVETLRSAGVRIAVPGVRTTAFLTLGLLLGKGAMADASRFVEVAFDQIIPAVRDGRAKGGEIHAGLVIHEGQVTFRDAGLREIADLGAWWQRTRGLPLPLGVNAIRRDLDERCGPGTVREVAALLEQSLDYAMTHRDEAIEYTMPYALLNAKTSGTAAPTRDVVERYVDMYVTELTRDMGQQGRTAIEWLLREGAEAGLCPAVVDVDVV
jgi:1,4-dihydroxy-6-naphthoate synthase